MMADFRCPECGAPALAARPLPQKIREAESFEELKKILAQLAEENNWC